MRLSKGVAGLVLALVATGFPGVAAIGQAYPGKAVRFIVPFPPGGGADVTARTVGQKMSEGLGQPVVIDNRAGGGGNIGTEITAKAPADGYTILLTTNGHAIQPNLQKLPWDPVKDFAPVSLVVSYPLVLVVHPSVPANSVKELIAYAKAHPGKLNYGSSGTGANLHLAAELFKSVAGVDIVHVPYKGNAPMTTALLSGEVQMVLDSMTGPLPHVRAGKLRVLAVTGRKRAAVLPDLPTIIEAGLPGLEYEAWSGVLAPAGTPREIIARLNNEIVKSVAAPEVKERLSGLGYDPVSDTPEHFAALIASDLARFARIIKEAGIKAD